VKKLISLKPFGLDALAIVRIFTGILMLLHGRMVFDPGIMKSMAVSLGNDLGLPFPLLMAYLAKGSEFFGGLLFALGFLTRIISIPLIITMAVATFGAHHGQITGDGEHAFLFLLIFAAFLFIGSGKWSIDYLVTKKH
jgi:putative oxidoreductase